MVEPRRVDCQNVQHDGAVGQEIVENTIGDVRRS